jgi:hypothetical protein
MAAQATQARTSLAVTFQSVTPNEAKFSRDVSQDQSFRRDSPSNELTGQGSGGLRRDNPVILSVGGGSSSTRQP